MKRPFFTLFCSFAFATSLIAADSSAESEISESSCPESMWCWFPSQQVQLGNMISHLDLLGTVAIKERALIKSFPVSNWVQDFKTTAANNGFFYALHTSYAMAALDNRVAGMQSFEQLFASSLAFRWNVLNQGEKTSTWLSFQADSSYSLGKKNPNKRTLQDGLGSATKPNNGVSYPLGTYFKEIALAQSFNHGNGVFIFGMVGDTNYMDVNTYAGTQYGMFLNSAFCNSMVFPACSNNLGAILQYQVFDNIYLMGGLTANNAQVGDNPFHHLSTDNVSYLMEIGWTDKNAFGIGAGTYKIQPFLATVEGETQPGISFNMSQDLGKSPFALFGRAGVGGSRVTTVGGAQAQISGGLVIKRPFEALGIVEEDSSNFFGIAGVWTKTASHTPGWSGKEETAVEFNYSIQLTPTVIIQPNFQLFFNPAYNPDHNFASIFQLQVSINW